MAPGCTISDKYLRDECDKDDVEFWQGTADELYPEHGFPLHILPGEVRDWMVHRRHLVDAWKYSCEEFRHDFTRRETCYNNLASGTWLGI